MIAPRYGQILAGASVAAARVADCSGTPEMDGAVVGVVGTFLGVLLGSVAQQVQASRSRHWQQADLLRTVKQGVYVEYVRSISASYALAPSGQRSRTEDTSLLAATAEIEILCGKEVRVPARELTDTVIGVHAKIAAGGGVPESEVADADGRRLEFIELFKADLGLRSPAIAVQEG